MKTLTLIVVVLASVPVYAQFSGYQSLSLPTGARNAGLGGRVITLADGDVMQVSQNPAVLDSVRSSAVGINYSPYFAGIYSFSGAYAAALSKLGKVGFGISYLDYGDFQERDANGDATGSFTAHDLAISMSKSHQVGAFTMGVSLKYAQNSIAGYGSSLLLGDLGGIYRVPGRDWTIGLVFKNFGFVAHNYTNTGNTHVPFDVQIGTTFKPEHMPLRFSVTAYNLTANEVYFQADEEVSSSKTVEIADKIFRKVNLGAELILHPRVQLLVSYNHLRQQELKLANAGNGAGFSFGLMLHIKQFHIRYAHATYHASGGSDFFTVQTSINSFKKIL